MEQIYSQNSRKIIQNKNSLEKNFNVKLSSKNRIVSIEGNPEEERLCLEAIEAINLGFSISEASLIKEEDIIFERLNLKQLSSRKNLSQIRARIIGTNRRALNTIESLTDTRIMLHDNTIGIIGSFDNVSKAVYSLRRIISGSEHSSVYSYLEEQKALEG